MVLASTNREHAQKAIRVEVDHVPRKARDDGREVLDRALEDDDVTETPAFEAKRRVSDQVRVPS